MISPRFRPAFASLLAALVPLVPAAAGSIEVAPGASLAEAVAKAKAGDVVVLGAGTYAGGVSLPAGVSIRGAGHRATIVDAGKAAVGIALEPGTGAEVADLTIRGGTTGLMIRGGTKVAVRRVRATGAITGIRVEDADGTRVENVVANGNRYGIVVGRGRGVAVVNCTIANNEALGLSLASGSGHAAFNDCLAGNSSGIFVGEVAGALVDHNLYFCLTTGKYRKEVARKSLQDWKYLTGLDARSVEIPVTFREPASGDLRPSGTLGWSLARAATSDWGAAKLGEFAAPEADIDGRPRSGRFDVGAFEVAPEPTRPADGVLVVKSDAGIKSAGIFDGRGHLVAYQFHNLPLPAGEHPYWFPPRDYLGRKIAAGAYELRTVEADHRWEYLGWVGDTGEAGPPGKTASVALSHLAFDDRGHLVAAQGWSEDATNVRGYDAATGKVDWTFPGMAMAAGLSAGPGGLYFAYQAAEGWDLLRLDPATGSVVPDAKGRPRARVDVGKDVEGFAVLGGKMFVTDRAANKVRIGPVDGSAGLTTSVDVPAPECPAADPTTGVVWVLSAGRKVLALGPDGSVLAERDFGALGPRALAAGFGRLAVASAAEGLVRVLELPDPKAKAKAGWTVGRGDGPFGPYLPDRFLFQQAPGAPPGRVALALGPKGELAVADQNRLLVFDPKGAYLWGTYGLFGNATAPSFVDPRRAYDTDGRRSLLLEVDDQGRPSWRPEAYWDIPVSGEFLGDFRFDGRAYAFVRVAAPGRPFLDHLVLRLDGSRAVPVYSIAFDMGRKRWYARRDANGDGRLDPSDGGEVVTGPDGKPADDHLFARFESIEADGSLLSLDPATDKWATVWRPSRGPGGDPEYRPEGRRSLPRPAGQPVSPYTRKPARTWVTAGCPDPAGGLVMNLGLEDSPDGMGLANNAGTDLAAVDRDGRVRWVHALDRDKGLEGLAQAGPAYLAGIITTVEILAVDRDGLGLGSFSPPMRARYAGYFIDHPQAVRAYRGPDGRDYALIADNFDGQHHWFRLDGAERIVRASASVPLPAATAEALAAQPAPPAYVPTRPPQPVVRIPRLAGPLKIDGGLAKWREAGVRPQVVITPEASGGQIDGPADCSAVVRLAYHGDDLYAQFLVFDDVVSFHQEVPAHHMQDGVEMCLNGFLYGFKFDVTRTIDLDGPMLLRNRAFFVKMNWAMPESAAPRSVTVLDDARGVPERELLESVYGVDLARSRVTVVEFRLPIDATTYKDAPDALKEIAPLRPGREFWLGFLVNDNDAPGTNVQNFLLWPPTYNNFGAKEDGARAVLE